MGVLYHIRSYFVRISIFPDLGLVQALHVVGTSNQSVPDMAIDEFRPVQEEPATVHPWFAVEAL